MRCLRSLCSQSPERVFTVKVNRKIKRRVPRALARRLIALGALDVDTEGHGGMFLVDEKARPILRGEAEVLMRQTETRSAAIERPRKRTASAVGLRR